MTINPDDLTPEEKKILKEVVQNFMAASRLGRVVKAWLLGFASVLGAGVLIWEFFVKRM